MSIFDNAIKLVSLGLPIIPLCSYNHDYATQRHLTLCKCAGKSPLIKGWQTHNSTTTDNLLKWKQQFKSMNIGLPLGPASGYCGIDIDGAYGEEQLLDFSKGDVPTTWEFSTGAGRRLLYTLPPGTKTKKFKKAAETGGHQECAFLTEGQQTVLPPSIHHTGKLYSWREGHSPWDVDCADAPGWLIDILTSGADDEPIIEQSSDVFNLEDEFMPADFDVEVPDVTSSSKRVKTQKGKSGHTVKVTEDMLNVPIPEGQRDNTMTAIIGHFCAKRELRLLGEETLLNVCLDYNRKWCDPPLEDDAVKHKVKFFFEAEKMKDAKYKESGAKPQFEPSVLAAKVYNDILKHEGLFVTYDQYTKMFYYAKKDQGPWFGSHDTLIMDRYIRQVVTSRECGHKTWDKRSYIEEVRRAFMEQHTNAFVNDNTFDIGRHAQELCKYIVVENGMLDWKTGMLLPWDPNYRTTIGFSLEYDPTAKCPKFEEYLRAWLPDRDTRMVIQEYLGYCLIPNAKFRTALFLYGSGKNGKSMLVELMARFFDQHASVQSYDKLSTRFGTAKLRNKLVNIFDDTSVSFTKETSLLKNLIAGGTTDAEFKGKDSFEFTNVARFIFSSQETPKTSDTTIAWYDRWFFIKFPNQFISSARVKTEMENNMNAEMPGIFNWMLEGLRRLMSNDEFTISKDVEQSKIEYKMHNDNVLAFFDTMCKVDRSGERGEKGTIVKHLFQLYHAWCEYEGYRALGKANFLKRLQDANIQVKKGYCDGRSGQSFAEHIFVDVNCEAFRENALEYRIIIEN